MSPNDRIEAEAHADRALRRGELSTALSLYQQIASAFPQDAAVQGKLRLIRESLQPMELNHQKTRAPLERPGSPANAVQLAEAHAAKGDYGQAIALYRKALEDRPDSDLVRERLTELFQIAQSMAPRAGPSEPTPTPRSAPSGSSSNPPSPQETSQPSVSTARLLSDLLDQIGRRRRSVPETG